MRSKKNNFFPFSLLTKKRSGILVFSNPFKRFAFTKRQKFVLSVVILASSLFFSEYFIGKSTIFFILLLALSADLLFLWAIRNDLKENFSLHLLILPFFYSISFGLFFFLVPTRLLSRIVITSLYAIGLYSLFLSQNIFIVASIRTIALLSSARTVSFILILITYFFLSNVIFSLHLSLLWVILILSISSFFLVAHSLWMYTLEKSINKQSLFWTFSLTGILIELAFILWFWPTTPTVIALFFAGFLYAIVGLSHVWIEKRLFKRVLWEYIWVGAIVSFILLFFTFWKAT